VIPVDPLALPKRYYATETKPIHLVGYTLALGMMIVGLAETVHSVPYMIRGESTTVGKILGPAGVITGAVMATLYLKEAGIGSSY
jgi:hypothetical protein